MLPSPCGSESVFYLGDTLTHVGSLELHSFPGGGMGTQMCSLIWTLLRSYNTFPVCVDLLIFPPPSVTDPVYSWLQASLPPFLFCHEHCQFSAQKKKKEKKLFGTSVVKTLQFQYRGYSFDPWLGNKDLTCCVVSQKLIFKKLKKNHLRLLGLPERMA